MTTKEFNNVLREGDELNSLYKKYYRLGFKKCKKSCIEMIKSRFANIVGQDKFMNELINSIEKMKEK